MTGSPVRLVVQSHRLDDDGDLLHRLPPTGGMVWLRRGEGMVGLGEALRLRNDGPERFVATQEQFDAIAAAAEVEDDVQVPGSGLLGFGSFTFDARSSGSVFVIPRMLVGRRDGVSWVTRIGVGAVPDEPLPDPVVAPRGPADRPRFAGASIPDVAWLEAVATAVERIESGEVVKVVLARDHAVWSKAAFDPRVLTDRLAERFPGCLTFLVDDLVGATPELLVRRTGSAVESLALAGSARRGADAREDQRIGAELLGSDKDRREHDLAAVSVRNVLGARCDALRSGDEPHVLRLDNVMHLATRFTGRLARPDHDTALALAGALHPTAAVGGVPTDVAVAMIRELEGMDRGRYAGPVGWMDARGDGEWGIALRCAELSGARARLFAGAGIVAGSLPEDELEETRLKLRAMQSVLEPADR